jgi:hypothetical protein
MILTSISRTALILLVWPSVQACHLPPSPRRRECSGRMDAVRVKVRPNAPPGSHNGDPVKSGQTLSFCEIAATGSGHSIPNAVSSWRTPLAALGA